MDLFEDVVPHGTNVSTGEVDLFQQAMQGQEEGLPPRTEDDEAIMQAAREALGLGKGQWLTIETEADLNKRLQQRNHIIADLKTAQDHVKHIQKQLDAWTHLFEKQCEAYYQLNPPKKGKTLSTPFGKLSSRTVNAGYAIDDESKLQQFLEAQKDNWAKWGVKPVTHYTRNIEAVKKQYLDEYKRFVDEWQAKKPDRKSAEKYNEWLCNKPKPFVPLGLKFTDTHESFSIKHGE